MQMTGLMMSYTKPNILSSLKLINKNLSANLQQRPMQLGTRRLILLQATHQSRWKFCLHGNSLFPVSVQISII